jgi:hypothetical protein
MIQAYGSSLPDEDEEKPKLKNSNGTSGGPTQSFEERCKKRKIILDILSNPGITHEKKKDILQNKEEYISDPNIFVQANGDIKYITESNERKRVTHDYDPVSNYLISQTDDFKGSWGSCLARAKQLKEQSKYPVMYVPWDEEKQWFKTESLNEIEAVRNVIGESSFKPVRFFITVFVLTILRSTRCSINRAGTRLQDSSALWETCSSAFLFLSLSLESSSL